jgi:hypothetical protein
VKTALVAAALLIVFSAATMGIARTGAAPVVAENAQRAVAFRTSPVAPAPNRLSCEQVPAVCAPALGVSLLTLAAPAALIIGSSLAALRRPLFEPASTLRANFVRVHTPPPRAA